MKMFLDFLKNLKAKPKTEEEGGAPKSDPARVLTSSGDQGQATTTSTKKLNTSKKGSSLAGSKEDAEGPLSGEAPREETNAECGDDEGSESDQTIDSEEDSDSTVEAEISAKGLFGGDSDENDGEEEAAESFGGLFGDDDDDGGEKKAPKAETPEPNKRRFLRGRRKKAETKEAQAPKTKAPRRGRGAKVATAFTPTASSAKATERLILELRELKKAMATSAAKTEAPKIEVKPDEKAKEKETQEGKEKEKEGTEPATQSGEGSVHTTEQDPSKEAVITSASSVVGAGEEVKSLEGFSVSPVGDNLYKWHVRFFDFDPSSQIFEDLAMYAEATGRAHVLLEVIFPGEYPDHPPFMRIVYPRFHQYTGHITIGGSVCVRDLTKTGWSSEYKLGPFLIMIRNLLVEGGALVDMDNAYNDYTEAEARDAFNRVALQHGWTP